MKGLRSVRRVLSIKDGRVELLYLRIELPSAEESEKINVKLFNDYYLKIAKCAEEWAGTFALDEIKKEYRSLGEHEKKFKFRRYEYNVSFKTEEIDKKDIAITVSFDLMRRKKVLKQKEKTDYWDVNCLLMKTKYKKQ